MGSPTRLCGWDSHEGSSRVRESADDVICRVDAATAVGKVIAEKAKAAGIETVAFDRSGFKYHGRIKALAESARENGLKF